MLYHNTAVLYMLQHITLRERGSGGRKVNSPGLLLGLWPYSPRPPVRSSATQVNVVVSMLMQCADDLAHDHPGTISSCLRVGSDCW